MTDLKTLPSYPLAPQGVFRTIQGEGILLGEPMIFVRLAGCDVNCSGCDTDYRVGYRASLAEVLDRVGRLRHGAVRWVWITGGEPTLHDLTPLVAGLHQAGLRVAVATAGVRRVQQGLAHGGVDFLSVSPHSLGSDWVQRSGSQLNLVPGLNGLRLSDVAALAPADTQGFAHRYITPLAGADGEPVNLAECAAFVSAHPGWRLGIQAHKHWRMP